MKLFNISVLMSCIMILFSGCGENSDNPTKVQRDVFAMDTYMSLTAYGNRADTALDGAENEIRHLESLLAVNSEKSDVWQINHSESRSVQVADETAEIISSAIEYGDSTGTLDITIYPVLREWGFTTGEYQIPDSAALDRLLENVDYTNIQLDGNRVSVPENYMIDLGAVANMSAEVISDSLSAS